MKPLITLQDVYEYRSQILLQKRALKDSTGISELERMNLLSCYEYQIGICDAKLTGIDIKQTKPFHTKE